MGTKSIFAVSAGCYSDYRVLFVCEDEETAEQCAQVVRGCDESYHSDAAVESFTVYGKGEVPKRTVVHRAEAILRDDGAASEPRYWCYSQWDFDSDKPASRPVVDYCRAPVLNNQAGYLRIYGAKQEAVAKVMTERLASFKAGSWMPHRESKVTP